MSSMELRKIDYKIECAKKFFSKITPDQVKYDVFDSYVNLTLGEYIVTTISTNIIQTGDMIIFIHVISSQDNFR